MAKKIASMAVSGNVDDSEYKSRLEDMQHLFEFNLSLGPLFVTDADPDKMWKAYISKFSKSSRRFHDCSECRHFIKKFGGLVVIDENGITRSAVWDTGRVDLEPRSVEAVLDIVSEAEIVGPFFSSVYTLGVPVTGEWRHFGLRLPNHLLFHRKPLLTARQAMAKKREDFENVMAALTDFDHETIATAVGILRADALYRGDKVLGPAEWLFGVSAARCLRPRKRENLVWRAIATAPDGFCHPRSSMIGTLLEDIAKGVDIATAAKKFAAKMHPLRYMRPQAAPKSGNIDQAEKIVAKLGIQKSLERRFSRPDEIPHFIWESEPKNRFESRSSSGVFGHLRSQRQAHAVELPLKPVTFERFQALIVGVGAIEVLVPYSGNFFALTTASYPDAPPILEWDHESARNPFSWYTYTGGTTASQWNLTNGWAAVSGIVGDPCSWIEAIPDSRAIALIPNCRDTRTGQGNAIFPENLKSDLREIRSTIEAFSRSAEIGQFYEESAAGLNVVGARFRVHDPSGVAVNYFVDRMR